MTTEDEKFERIAQRHIAALKKSSKVIVEDAAVRAVHKVMAEFDQGAHTEAKIKYHTTMIQCPHCDGSVRVPVQPYPDNFIDALKYDVAKRDSEAQQQQEPVAWITHNGKGWLRWHKPEDNNIDSVPLYTSPQPSKPWVGLSTIELDEIDAPIRERGHATIAEIYRAIEAKLREKNA